MTGANFNPSTAMNQLEIWQEATFDAETIDRKLDFAVGIGFNTMRVYLHSLAYKVDWGKTLKMGKQLVPVSGTHNSGWVQDPGNPASKEEKNYMTLEICVKHILKTFGDDKRILIWDIYNEPGNTDKLASSMSLLEHVFTCTKEINPNQPLTVVIGMGFSQAKCISVFKLRYLNVS